MTTSTTLEYRTAGVVPNQAAYSRWSGGGVAGISGETPVSTTALTGRYGPAKGVERLFTPHFAKLDAIATDASLVPPESEGPCETSLAWAAQILKQLLNVSFPPTRVTASAEGGVAICFIQGDKYADFECLNTGEILGVTSNRKDRPTVWEIEPSARDIARAANRIRKFLEPQTPQADVSPQ